MLKIFILAILIRLLIMPFYFHPDIRTTYFQTSFLKQGVFDIYKYIESSKAQLPFKDDFTYFPLTYLFFGGYQILISPLLGANFHTWIFDASAYAPTQIGVFRYLLLLKIPYLIFDIATAYLLTLFFEKLEDKKKALIYWLFNPIWLFLIYAYSNLDIIPAFIALGSMLLFIKNKKVLSAILIGIAAGFKAYPLLFLPFMMLYTKNFKQSFLVLFSGLMTFFLIIFPFWSESFKNQALISGLTTRIFLSSLSIGFGQILPLALIAFAILFFYILISKDKNKKGLYKTILAELLLLFSFIHFHISWLLWLGPIATIILINKKSLYGIILVILSTAFAIPLLYQDQAMTFGLLKVISPLYNLLPIPFTIIQHFHDPYMVQSVLQSFLAGGSLVLIWNMFRSGEI